MYLQVDNERICLLNDKDKEMLSKHAEEADYLNLVQKVYIIAVLAFMAGMKYMKENE